VLIARQGRLAVEEYFDGWTADRPHTMQSVTKSVVSLLVGIAARAGELSIDDPAVAFFPGYAPLANCDDLAHPPHVAARGAKDVVAVVQNGTERSRHHRLCSRSPQRGHDRY